MQIAILILLVIGFPFFLLNLGAAWVRQRLAQVVQKAVESTRPPVHGTTGVAQPVITARPLSAKR